MYKKLFLFYLFIGGMFFFSGISVSAQPKPAITHTAYETLGRRIELEMAKNNAAIFVELFDKAAFVQRISGDVPASERAYYDGMTKGFDLEKMAVETQNNFGVGGYRFLRAYEKNGEHRLLFRLFGAAGLNYHDFVVIRKGDSLKLADILVYTLGEQMSEYFAHAAQIMRMTSEGGKDLSSETKEMLTLTKCMQQKDYASAVKILETSKSKLLQYRSVQQYHIMASKQLGDSLYIASLERYGRLFPDAPNWFLYQLDAYLAAKEYAKGLAAVDILDSAVNGDPYLDFFRGNFYSHWDKAEEAIAAYNKLFISDPLMTNNTQSLILRWLELGDVDSARAILDKYRAVPGHDKSAVASLYDEYPELKAE